MWIFAEVQYLYKRFKIAMTLKQDFWNMIAILITLDSVYNNFDITNISLLESREKTIDQI